MVPTEEAEDRRHVHREYLTTTQDRVRVRNRIHGLLATHGVHVAIRSDFAQRLATLQRWDGTALPVALRQRLEREWAKVQLLTTHLKALEAERRRIVRCSPDPMAEQIRRLITLRGVGEHSAWVFVAEHFGWRELRN